MTHPLAYVRPSDLTGGECLKPRPNEEVDPFFPEGRGAKQQERYALSICKKCPTDIRDQCLADTLEYERGSGYSWGVSGGLTAGDRAKLLGRPVRRMIR